MRRLVLLLLLLPLSACISNKPSGLNGSRYISKYLREILKQDIKVDLIPTDNFYGQTDGPPIHGGYYIINQPISVTGFCQFLNATSVTAFTHDQIELLNGRYYPKPSLATTAIQLTNRVLAQEFLKWLNETAVVAMKSMKKSKQYWYHEDHAHFIFPPKEELKFLNKKAKYAQILDSISYNESIEDDMPFVMYVIQIYLGRSAGTEF